MEASFRDQHYSLQDKLRQSFPASIAYTEKRIELLEQDVVLVQATQGSAFKMSILGETFSVDVNGHSQKEEVGKALLDAAKRVGMNQETVGEYRGFKLGFHFNSFSDKIYLNITGATAYNVELGKTALGNLTRIENAINSIPNQLEAEKRKLENLHNQVKTAKEEL